MAHRHNDVANIAMIGRMIRSAGERIGGYDPDQLARLAALREVLDDAMRRAVAGQRAQGVTWQTIGAALGVSKQAVVQRYGPSSGE